MALKMIDAHDAAAFTIIADYPDMPDSEFEAMLDELSNDEAREMAKRIRRSAVELERSPHTVTSDDDSDAFVRSAAASAGRL